MKRTAIITLGLIMALAATGADARTASSAGGGSTSAPQPVSAEDMRLVIRDVAILDGSGTVLASHHCEWTEPEEDDRPCLAFSGDPRAAYDAIQEVGGSAATVATRAPDLEFDTLTRINRRADGTWLFRTEGTVDGKPWYRGHVCSADGRTCTPYAATSRKRAKRAIKAATGRVKKRSR